MNNPIVASGNGHIGTDLDLLSLGSDGSPNIDSVETYSRSASDSQISRHVFTSNGGRRTSSLQADRILSPVSLSEAHDAAWLASNSPPWVLSEDSDSIRIADLFCGAGLMTLGALEACRALRLGASPILAIDVDSEAADTYRANFPTAEVLPVGIDSILDSELGARLSNSERELKKRLGRVDLLLGGPPCQGHSNLNNHTRRGDVRNSLFLKMARFAEVVEPEHIIVENVRDIARDRSAVAARTQIHLDKLGYDTSATVLSTDKFGVPQRRQRYVLIASKSYHDDISQSLVRYETSQRTFGWACADLSSRNGRDTFNTPSTSNLQNVERMTFLFDNNCYDLPNALRPKCHREDESHSYKSVYGRLHWDRPSQTITTGFGCMGQGRFVHPLEKRTLTPHEAARLQFIPDFFKFPEGGRSTLSRLIGNAVPPKLAYIVALELLR